MVVTLNYNYRIYPDAEQEVVLNNWLETCRKAYNYALWELKDWLESRKCSIDRCSLECEYIMPSDYPFPGYHYQQNSLPAAKKNFPRLAEIPSQTLQAIIRRLHDAWDWFRERGHGFPKFKKFGQLKSLLFPQFRECPLSGFHLKLPKIGLITINLHRAIPNGFVIKQVSIVKKANLWYANLNIQCDVDVPDVMPYGHPIGVDVGLEKFLATSEGSIIRPVSFLERCKAS